MLYRSDRNYPEAIKCYRNALRIDAENQQIMRDLAYLQVHVRDLRGHVDTRLQLLTSKNYTQSSWVSFAVAHQLAGNFEMALGVLDKFESTLDPTRLPSYETSELVFLKARLCEQAGDLRRALSILDDPRHRYFVVDSLTLNEQRAKLLLATEQYAAAADEYSRLLTLNPDNVQYHRGLHAALLEQAPDTTTDMTQVMRHFEGMAHSAQQTATLLAVYLRLLAQHPKCRTVARIVLAFLPADHALFLPLLSSYVRFSVRKGIPALYSDLKQMARADSGLPWSARVAAGECLTTKGKILLDSATAYARAAETGSVLPLPPLDVAAALSSLPSVALFDTAMTAEGLGKFLHVSGDGKPEDPTSYPWAALLAARLLDDSGAPKDAISMLDSALQHTPTVIDLLLAKGKSQKHVGALADAAATMDYARGLDLADRFLNTKCTKYMLRADRVRKAEDSIALFVRHDSKRPDSDPLGAMRDLQVIWFDLEEGAALERLGLIGPALKRYLRVHKYFSDFTEDAFDFHSYCMRRSTFRAYHDMMSVQDHLRSHTGFLHAAAGAARCYLRLHREPQLRASTVTGLEYSEAELAAMTPEARVKAEKGPEAAADAGEKKGKAAEAKGSEEEDAKKDVDQDPNGLKLVADATNPLELAAKYARLLSENLPGHKTANTESERAVAIGPEAVPHAGADISTVAVVGGAVSGTWTTSAQLAASCHALCADVELESGLVGQALAHARKVRALHAAALSPDLVAKLRTAVAARAGQPGAAQLEAALAGLA